VAYSESAGRPARRKSKLRGDDEEGDFERAIYFNRHLHRTEGQGWIEPEKSCRPSHATHHQAMHPSTPVPHMSYGQAAPFVGFSSFHSAPSKEALFLPHPGPKACCERNTGDSNGSIKAEQVEISGAAAPGRIRVLWSSSLP
jgi:hypothetical protein